MSDISLSVRSAVQRAAGTDPAAQSRRARTREPQRSPGVPSASRRRCLRRYQEHDRHTAATHDADGIQGSPLDRRLTFASFLLGRSNALAHAAAERVSRIEAGAAPLYNPLYIHSAVGLGKTHLLQAVAHEVITGGKRVIYLTADRFMYGFVAALKAQTALAFKERLRGIDLLVIDDVQFLQGKSIQQEFCHTINALIDAGRQVVIAADRPPSDLETLDERVRSRLAGGLVVEMGSLDEALRVKILEARIAVARDPPARLRGQSDGDGLSSPASITTNGRDLDGAVNRLLAHSTLSGGPLTVEAAETAIRDLVRSREPKKVRIEDIQKLVATHYNVSRADILSSRRSAGVVKPRQIAMYLAKQLTLRSLPEIGRRFGGRDHTTVLHAVRKIDGVVAMDPVLRRRNRAPQAHAAGVIGPVAPGLRALFCELGAIRPRAAAGRLRLARPLANVRDPCPSAFRLAGPYRGCRKVRRSAMKVTVERSALLKSLGHVHRVVERRNTIPILSNVLIRAENGRLSLKATDLDLEVTESFAADVAQPGATTVPAHVIYDIVRKLADGAQVSLETTGDVGQVLIRSGRSRFNLQSLPEADFPDLATGEMSHHFSVGGAELKRLIEKTQFAISTEETRYYLNGIYFPRMESGGKSVLRAVATDGHRLARVETDAPGQAPGHARRDHPAQGRRRDHQAGRRCRRRCRDRTVLHQDPLDARLGGADLQADRRHVPRLPARDPGRQRQATGRRQGRVRCRGGSRFDDFVASGAGP